MATKQTCTRVSKLIDADVVIQPASYPWGWGRMTVEEQAAWLERWASDFFDFVRDHRSQDVNSVSIKRTFQDQCSACGAEWEIAHDEETGEPFCAGCGATMEVTR